MSEEKLDRFARGDLPPAEARELAQKSLDDPELFDELTGIAVARHGIPKSKSRRIAFPRLAMLAAAAALVFAFLFYRVSPPPVQPPMFLARSAGANASEFRGSESDSRGPRAQGSVTSIAEGAASIDLGSLDGLSKGDQVDVIRDGGAIAKITLTTIFRDHARGDAAGSAIRGGDQVRLPAIASARLALDQIDQAISRHDSDGARRIAQTASIQDGAGLSAAQDLNNAAIIAELHGDTALAADLYNRALQSNPAESDRQAIDKNLARVRAKHP